MRSEDLQRAIDDGDLIIGDVVPDRVSAYPHHSMMKCNICNRFKDGGVLKGSAHVKGGAIPFAVCSACVDSMNRALAAKYGPKPVIDTTADEGEQWETPSWDSD